MDIQQRIVRLKYMMDKSASSLPKTNSLFPKLEGPHNPPKLTSDSQPKIDIRKPDVPTLPTMRENGRKPLFSSTMKNQNPYQKN